MLAKLKVLFPLSYLRIKHSQANFYNYGLPALIAGIVFLWFWFMPEQVNIFGKDGLIDKVNSLLTLLIGFFIAALAAIATFESNTMDKPMKGTPTPTLVILHRGAYQTIELSRRRFLSIMFGYASFLSIILYVGGTIIQLSLPSFELIIPHKCLSNTKLVFLIGYLFVVANLFITTLLGLYFLSDRIFRD